MARLVLASLAAAFLRCCLGDAVEADCKDGERPGLSFIQAKALARDSPNAKKVDYLWSSGRGNFPNYGVSPASAPFDLAHKKVWNWSHPLGRFATLTYGTAIDHQRNIYLSGADGVRKFDHKGKMLWEYDSLPAEMMDAPSLHDGKLYGSDTQGNVVALDMESGEVVWRTKVAKEIGQDNGFTMAKDGVVLAATDFRLPSPLPTAAANHKVQALNASNGSPMWSFEPDTPVWNFLPLFVDEGDFVFQDMTGKAYRVDLHTGSLIWKSGGLDGTWTDGSAAVGNGMVFTVHNNKKEPLTQLMGQYEPGTLSAYNLSNGELVWKLVTPRPPNNAPAVGKVKGLDGVSVVMPLCQQIIPGSFCDVHVYDADTGDLQWVFHGPQQTTLMQAGDLEGIGARTLRGIRSTCLPNGWSAPSIDAHGTVFVGNEQGNLFALRDMDGDGTIYGDDEISSYDTQAAFSGSSSPAIAPGLLAVASCDSLFVFKD